MKPVVALTAAVLFVSALAAQNRAGFVPTPGVTRGFSSAVFPAGTSAMPGIQRTTGNILFPAGGGPQIGVPAIPYINPTLSRGRVPLSFQQPFGPPNRRARGNAGFGGFGYAVYAPGYSDQQPYMEPPPPPQSQPVNVIYPPAPVIINQYGPAEPRTGPATRIFGVPGREPQPQPEETADNGPAHYMLAFKDHSVYAAIAYWIDGDTLHYFTAGNTHNQASLSLVDRELTDRLNKDTGVEVKLPPAK